MKKSLLYFVLSAAAALLSGCSTSAPVTATPPPPASVPEIMPEPAAPPVQAPATQSMLLDEMQKTAAAMGEAGGLAAVGTGESKSLELALNKAKVNGRRELAQMMSARFDLLEKSFSEETGIPLESLLLSGFNNAFKIIKEQQIAGSVAQALKYETTGDTFTAYAVMALDPKIIADQLSKEKELYARLQTTKAFGELMQEAKTFAAFKAAQK